MNNFTTNRLIWGLSILGFSLIIGGALFFQHVKGMEPCYLCIIQRIGVLISIFGSILGFINPKIKPLNILGILTILSGLGVSLYSSIKLVYLQLNPPIFSSCGMSAKDLMDNYGFLNSLPHLFKGSASCTESVGNFLFLSFEQWTLLLFSIITLFLFALIILLIKQKRKNDEQ